MWSHHWDGQVSAERTRATIPSAMTTEVTEQPRAHPPTLSRKSSRSTSRLHRHRLIRYNMYNKIKIYFI